jgi:hypothetical protein
MINVVTPDTHGLQAPTANTFVPIPGEYEMVTRQSVNVDALRAAHTTSCTVKEATAMLRSLATQYLTPEQADDLKLVFGGTKRGRGGFIAVRKRKFWFMSNGRTEGPYASYVNGEPILGPASGKPRYRMEKVRLENGCMKLVPYIGLPRVPMVNGVWWSVKGSCLRVGLVLHEFAHVMSACKVGGKGHGPVFVNTLDLLVAVWMRDSKKASG